jgi:hypothetical protein
MKSSGETMLVSDISCPVWGAHGPSLSEQTRIGTRRAGRGTPLSKSHPIKSPDMREYGCCGPNLVPCDQRSTLLVAKELFPCIVISIVTG